MDSPESKNADAKSATSKTSINVKLPSAQNVEEQWKKAPSPGAVRRKTPTHPQSQYDSARRSPSAPQLTGEFVATLEGQEFGQYRHSTNTPLSDRLVNKEHRSPTPGRHLRQPAVSEGEMIRQAAASIIEKSWIGYRDRQMFKLLKHAVCAAENSLSNEILRKVAPKEAEFMNDKCSEVRVRFRFGGGEFPPMIFFKVFIHSDGKGVKYLSGKRVIKPATGAAEDALKLMGNRQFYEQMLQDAMFQRKYKITDEIDVTTLKDYMQYLTNIDETPAKMGGKENYWRKLTLDVLPRHTVFYDIIDFLYNHRMTPRLREEIPLLITRPITQDIQIQHIRAVSEMRSPDVPMPTPKSKMSGITSQVSGRRSKQARIRAMKMRKMYGLDRDEMLDSRGQTAVSEEPEDYFDKYGITGEYGEEGDQWEREAKKLYEWTQELSFNDDLIGTPRLISGNIS
ncbi:uncharacterized protein CXorf58-like isoform X2 [Dreissena polymorpha]|uniref:Uncharacterized protein n=1 Tax=Dreissena polymorpha TaxID=45954 RepID=A0A9D4J9Y7_DREPO|nr:uncharacterized protein CXorf58-like isoform X2 [Dreissena polymorpha]KAH3805326.1 hypothetical protein DPMN_133626 [Dreissena polymorpha]